MISRINHYNSALVAVVMIAVRTEHGEMLLRCVLKHLYLERSKYEHCVEVCSRLLV